MLSLQTKLNNNPFKGQKVAILGDVMLDRFIYGDVERISPEAPVPVVRVSKLVAHLGGAGNVAANLAALEAKALLIGRIGDDTLGSEFLDLAKEEGVDTSYLFKSHVPTTSKTRVIARTQQVVRIDEESTDVLNDEERRRVFALLEKARKECDTLIISDYAKGVVDDKMLKDVKALWGGGRIFIDPKPRDEARNNAYQNTTTMTPNVKEALELTGFSKPKNDDEAGELAKHLVEKFDLDHVLLTRSGDGMTLFNDGKALHLKTKTQEVIDVSGAGDTVIAVFAAGIASGMSVEEAAHFANVSGGVVVAKLGTASLNWAEMKDGMEKYLSYQNK